MKNRKAKHSADPPAGARSPLANLYAFNKGLNHLLILSLSLTVLLSLCRQVIIYLLGAMVDSAGGSRMSLLQSRLPLFAGLILFISALSGIRNLISGKYTAQAQYRIREKTISHALTLPLSYFSDQSSGGLIGKINRAFGILKDFTERTFTDTLYTVCTSLFAAALGFMISWQMTSIILCSTLVCFFLALFFSKPLHRHQKESIELHGDISAMAQDSIGGFLEIKIFSIYRHFINKFNGKVDASVALGKRISRIECSLESILLSLSFSMQVIIVIAGLYFIHVNRLTLGELVIFQQIQSILHSLYRINFVDFRKASAAAEELTEIWNGEPEKRIAARGAEKKGDRQEPLMELKSLSFSYGPDGESGEKIYALRDIDLSINAGDTVAFVGPSGCGKSTLLKILAGFYRAERGMFFFKGSEIGTWDIAGYRSGISYVDQDPFLFPVTIFENIACGLYGRGDGEVAEEMVEAAAKKAGLERFVSGLPRGYRTETGERGVQLSGGERQRISIARAFLKGSGILIMDEPTSALDAATEASLQDALDKLREGTTSVVAAHRLQTVRNATRIHVMDRGRIVETGSHDELMAKRGLYYELYKTQLGLDLEEAL